MGLFGDLHKKHGDFTRIGRDVCMDGRMYGWIDVWMDGLDGWMVWMDGCVGAWVHARMHVCICTYVCMYVYIYICIHKWEYSPSL